MKKIISEKRKKSGEAHYIKVAAKAYPFVLAATYRSVVNGCRRWRHFKLSPVEVQSGDETTASMQVLAKQYQAYLASFPPLQTVVRHFRRFTVPVLQPLIRR